NHQPPTVEHTWTITGGDHAHTDFATGQPVDRQQLPGIRLTHDERNQLLTPTVDMATHGPSLATRPRGPLPDGQLARAANAGPPRSPGQEGWPVTLPAQPRGHREAWSPSAEAFTALQYSPLPHAYVLTHHTADPTHRFTVHRYHRDGTWDTDIRPSQVTS